MTKDEAVKIVLDRSEDFVCSERMARCLVDTWAAVGMLKLDEPKEQFTPDEIAADILEHYYFRYDFEKAKSVLRRLECAGLRIVAAPSAAR